MLVKEVLVKNVEDKLFYYITLGQCYRSKPCYVLWINKQFVNEWQEKKWGGSIETYRSVKFPIKNCDLITGKSEKNLILKQGDKNAFYFEIKGGVKGSSFIDEITSDDPDMKVYKFQRCHNEKCYNKDSGVLILTKAEKVKIKWHRNGKLLGKYDYPEGTTILYSDGRKEEINVDSEDLELLKELE